MSSKFLFDGFKALLDESGVSYRQNAGSIVMNCPKCRKKEKLSFYKSNGKFLCYYCKEISNFSGRAEYALREMVAIPLDEIRARIYSDYHSINSSPVDALFSELPDFYEDEDIDEEQAPLIEQLPTIPDHFTSFEIENKWSEDGVQYLEKRGIPLDIAVKYKIRYNPLSRSVIFPVYQNCELVGYQSRKIDKTKFEDPETGEMVEVPKAITYSGYKREKWLMFADNIVGDYCVLAEGPIDAIKADLCGNNVCALGKGISPTHIQILIDKGVKKLYLALDPDAVENMEKLVFEYGSDFQFFDMRPPKEFEDIGDMPFVEVKKLFDSAQPIDSSSLFLNLTGDII